MGCGMAFGMSFAPPPITTISASIIDYVLIAHPHERGRQSSTPYQPCPCHLLVWQHPLVPPSLVTSLQIPVFPTSTILPRCLWQCGDSGKSTLTFLPNPRLWQPFEPPSLTTYL